jgi:hypothetical protein
MPKRGGESQFPRSSFIVHRFCHRGRYLCRKPRPVSLQKSLRTAKKPFRLFFPNAANTGICPPPEYRADFQNPPVSSRSARLRDKAGKRNIRRLIQKRQRNQHMNRHIGEKKRNGFSITGGYFPADERKDSEFGVHRCRTANPESANP